MAQIRSRIALAGGTVAIRIKLLVGESVSASAHLQKSARREDSSPLRELSGHDAIKHVDAPVNGLKQVKWSADPHEVSRAVFWKKLRGELADVFALGFALSYCESADGVAVKGHLAELLHALTSEVWEESALSDAKQRLRRVAAGLEASGCPPVGDAEGIEGGFLIGCRWNALVEHHHDVAADVFLRIDAGLWGESNGVAFDSFEKRAFFRHFSRLRERKDLKPAGVREHATVPAHELVNAAHSFEDLEARAEHEVVGVC